MKQEFEMSGEELQAIYDISRNQMPVMQIGGVSCGQDKQEMANKLWRQMADNYGFVWDSVEGSARGQRFFLATPKAKVIPKTSEEIAMDKYDSIKKIVTQLESCNYESEGGYLVNNIAFLALKRMIK